MSTRPPGTASSRRRESSFHSLWAWPVTQELWGARPARRSELPGLRRARAAAGDPLAGPHQGRRRARERRPRAARPRHRRPDRRGRRRGRRGRARRPVPDRRLPDRLRHLVEHERQRGDRERSPATPCTRTTTSTWGSRRTTCSPRPCTSPRSTRSARRCCRRSSALERALAAKAEEFADVVKSGRTHLMDAVPVTVGQEFAGYAAQIRLGRARIEDALPHVAQIPLGGTATGTGLNTHPEFAAARARAARPGHRARDPRRPRTRSRRRATATRWSSCRAR